MECFVEVVIPILTWLWQIGNEAEQISIMWKDSMIYILNRALIERDDIEMVHYLKTAFRNALNYFMKAWN